MSNQYIQATELFYSRNNHFMSGQNVLNIVKDKEGRYVTSSNSYEEFPNLFDENYTFVDVGQTFYNEYNGTVLIPERTILRVRITNDNKYVVEENMRIYFSHLFTLNEASVQYTIMDFQDTYLSLTYDDFDHSNDLPI